MIRVRRSWPFSVVIVGRVVASVHLDHGAALATARRFGRMAKAQTRYRPRDTAICLRCGAPGNPAIRGGQLVPVKGLQGRRRAGGRKLHFKQHADPQFCTIRMGEDARRTSTSRYTRSPHVRKP